MSSVIQRFLIIVLFSFFFAFNALAAPEVNKKFLSVHVTSTSTKEETNPLQVILTENVKGIMVAIHYTNIANKKELSIPSIVNDATIEAGGEVSIFLDDMVVHRQQFKETTVHIDKNLDMAMIRNGEHKLLVEVFSNPGGTHQKNLSFSLDTTPVVEVRSLQIENGVIDPQFFLSLAGTKKDDVGFLEVHVDEKPVAEVLLQQKDVGKLVILSELIDKKHIIADLHPGTHLLRITVTAENGSQKEIYKSFEANSTPELTIKTSQENKFHSILATFPQTATGFYGGVEVLYRQGVIFSKQAEKNAELVITRADIEKAMTKQKHNSAPYPLALVFSAHANNGSEKWVKVDFR